MPDIQTLLSQAKELQDSSEWWTNAALWLTAATAIVAAMYFVASRVAINKGAELRRVQTAIASIKDEQDKDAQDKFDLELSKQQERAAKAEHDLFELQEKLAWRNLSTDQQERVISKLKDFPATPFQIRVFQEPEATALMEIIQDVLHASNWLHREPDGGTRIPTKYGEVGIAIGNGVVVFVDPIQAFNLLPASEALASSLAAEGIVAESRTAIFELNPHMIHIAIGKKP